MHSTTRIFVLPLKSSLVSIIVEMGHSTVGGDLGIDVASLAFIQIDLCLEDVNLLGLAFELRLEELLLLLDLALLFIVFVDKDLLVRAI